MLDVSLAALAARFEMLAESFERGGKFVDSAVFRGHRADDNWMPPVAGHDQGEHGVKLLFEAARSFAVAFVENKNVSDLHQAGFHVLNVVAEAGNQHDDDAIGQSYDINLILADANGLNQDLMLARCIEEKSDFRRSTREAPEKTSGGHGADENAAVAGVTLHADAVAENGAARVRACGVDGHDADALFLLAIVRGEAIDQRAFARAGRAGNASEIGLTGMREELSQQILRFGGMIFNRGDGPGDGAHIAIEDLGGPIVNGEVHCGGIPEVRGVDLNSAHLAARVSVGSPQQQYGSRRAQTQGADGCQYL